MENSGSTIKLIGWSCATLENGRKWNGFQNFKTLSNKRFINVNCTNFGNLTKNRGDIDDDILHFKERCRSVNQKMGGAQVDTPFIKR